MSGNMHIAHRCDIMPENASIWVNYKLIDFTCLVLDIGEQGMSKDGLRRVANASVEVEVGYCPWCGARIVDD